MENRDHYTGEDFQNYYDTDFNGDVTRFKEHLQQCNACNSSFLAYGSVTSFLKSGVKVELLQIDLATKAADKIFAKKTGDVFEKVMYGSIIFLLAAGLLTCMVYLMNQSVPVVFLFLLLPTGLYLLLSLQEIKLLQRKFA